MTGSDDSASAYPLPLTTEGVTAAWLSAGLRTRYPGVVVDQVEPVQVIDGTATKVRLRLAYGPHTRRDGLPDQMWVKGGFGAYREYLGGMGLYSGEVRFFNEIAPLYELVRPASYFGLTQTDPVQGVVALEDLQARGVVFARATRPLSVKLAAAGLRHGDDRPRNLRRPGGVMTADRPDLIGESRSRDASAKAAAVFCERWLGGAHRLRGVISESAARRRDRRGQPYMVVLGHPERPNALVEVNWSLDFLGTWFLDDKLRRNLHYAFARVDAMTLFLEQIILWEYPEDAVHDLNTATRITTLTYNQDGVVREAIDDSVAGTAEVISRSDVPLDINWEQVPKFGDWSRVTRRNRESC